MSYGPIACFGVTCEVEMAFTFLMVEIKFKTRIVFFLSRQNKYSMITNIQMKTLPINTKNNDNQSTRGK